MASNIPPEERLTNLVVALMATDRGLTKAQILESVSGYRQRAESGTGADALEKMFERDKDDLRGLGIPVETLGDHADPNDLREARYRIPKSEYTLPDDLTFTQEELALLTLAATVWREGSMSDDSNAGIRKIRSLGIDVDEPIIGFAPELGLTTNAFVPLKNAIEANRAVTFTYIKPGEKRALLRRVQPLALVEQENRWHLFGFDTDRGAERTFLLSRIGDDVKITRLAFDPALKIDAGQRALAGLAEVTARNVAHLEVHPGSEADLRLARRASAAAQGIDVPFLDLHIFADELASYGPEVRVISPDDLREQVIVRLQATLDRHQEAAHG